MIVAKQVRILGTENDRNGSGRVVVVETLKRETKILKNLDHPNVVQCLGFEETKRHFSMSVLSPFCHCHIAERGLLASSNMFRVDRLLASSEGVVDLTRM